MRYLFSFLLLLSYSASFGCYNEYYALDAKGHFHQIEMDHIRFNQYFDLKTIEKQLLSLEQKLKKKADFKLLSDYGLHLVQAGKVKEALVIFEKLAELHPNEYSIVANLGTTYELSGQNQKALEYIRKGIQLNPNSHGGSEWIHVKILEAKIAMEKNQDYLSNSSVLNLSSKQKQSQKVFDQLYIQLQERFPFSPKEPNPIMADLFVEMGDFYLANISFEHAKAFYQIAQIYYKSERNDIHEKIAQSRKLRETYANHQPETSTIKSTLPHKESSGGHTAFNKVSGVPYQNYVYNPTGSDYKINWSKIETNPEKLLGYLNIKSENSEDKKKIEDKKADSNTTPAKDPKSKKKADDSMLWIGLTLAILIISIFTYFRTKKKKR